MRFLAPILALLIAVAPAALGDEPRASAPRLRVSENQRFLVTDDGEPFF